MGNIAWLLQYLRNINSTTTSTLALLWRERHYVSSRNRDRFFFFFLRFYFRFCASGLCFVLSTSNAHNSRTLSAFSLPSFRSLSNANTRLASIGEFKPRVDIAGNKTWRTWKRVRGREWFEFQLFLRAILQFLCGCARIDLVCLKS